MKCDVCRLIVVQKEAHNSACCFDTCLQMDDVIRGFTSTDDFGSSFNSDQLIDASEREATLMVAAADAVTAENDLVSKTIGSGDPIDYSTQGK